MREVNPRNGAPVEAAGPQHSQHFIGPMTAWCWSAFTALWRWCHDLIVTFRPCRFSVLVVAINGVILIGVPQCQEALRGLAERNELPELRFQQWLWFFVAAVLLAALGIYSVIAFSAALRTQEMAIRMALGSQRSGIVRLVLASGAKLAMVGCVIGLGGAVVSSHLVRSFLFDVSAFDPLVLTLGVIAVFLLALAASLLPALRAASIDPIQSLHAE